MILKKILRLIVLVFGSLVIYKIVILLGYDPSSIVVNALIYGFSALTIEEIAGNAGIGGLLISVVIILLILSGMREESFQNYIKKTSIFIKSFS